MTEQDHLSEGNGPDRESIVLVKCSDLSEELFDRFYYGVLEPAFPPTELEDIGTLRAAYTNPRADSSGMVALRSHDPVGGMLGEYFTNGNVMLLAYLAVRADQRGTGLGSALIRDVLSMWRESFSTAVILAEVEDPRFHGTSSHGDPVARLRFYERAGSKLLPFAYFQPSLGGGLPRVRDMFLICMDGERDTVPREAMLAFLDEYVRSCEGDDVWQNDPEYQALRSQLEAHPDEIPLWPLARAGEVPRTGSQTPARHA